MPLCPWWVAWHAMLLPRHPLCSPWPQDHYGAEVAPRVAPSMAELGACAGGVVVVMKAVEEGCSLALQRVADASVIQVCPNKATALKTGLGLGLGLAGNPNPNPSRQGYSSGKKKIFSLGNPFTLQPRDATAAEARCRRHFLPRLCMPTG